MNRPESPASESPSFEASAARRRRRPGRRRAHEAPRLVAIGFMQLASLTGVIGLSVILGAVLVGDAKSAGWLDGLVIGGVSTVLTILILLSGRHVRRH